MFKFAKELSRRERYTTIITGSSCRPGVNGMGLKVIRKNLFYWEFLLDQRISVISLIDYYDQELTFPFRVASFISFALLSIILSSTRTSIDIVFASSTPLTIAIPAIILSKVRRIPFVFEVRDLWPDAPIQLGVLRNKALIAIANKLEKLAYGNADGIIGISRGICKKIKLRSRKPVVFIPNAVDEEFFEIKKVRNHRRNDEYPLKAVYAGACGFNNAIEVLFDVAKRAFEDQQISSLVSFAIVGDGPALKELRRNIPSNMELKGKLPKTETIEFLVNSDIGIFSQRKVLIGDLKKNSLNNKFFDFLGASLPIIAGLDKDGEMAHEINSNCCGIVVEPEDMEGLYGALKRLVLSNELRKEMSIASGKLAVKYSRKIQSARFASLLDKSVQRQKCGN